ncbi:MAG: 6-carboxytetrahydropterin synthase QueD [Oscillospiraceae bacterium]|nr:6-carboxytetrahydropterin synthase QueD [Oscillospiraceae bacterium]
MYYITCEAAFDSAHFLSGYSGKCSNLHGHRWTVQAKIKGELCGRGQHRGMVADFGDIKRDLREIADAMDHTLIYEEGSLRESTLAALYEEGFSVYPVPFRPTAENLSRYIYGRMEDCGRSHGYEVYSVTVWETPGNGAEYIP